MHDEPRPDAADPGDLTERHSTPPVDPSTASPITPSSRTNPAAPTIRPGRRAPGARVEPVRQPRRPLHASSRATRRVGAIVEPDAAAHTGTLVRAGADARADKSGRDRGPTRSGGRIARWRYHCSRHCSPRAARCSPLARPALSIEPAAAPCRATRATNVGTLAARRDRRVVGDDQRGRQGQPGRGADHGHRHHRRRQSRGDPRDRRRVRASSSTATAGS